MATIPLEAAAAAMRDAMRETVKRYSLWYLLQGILMVAAGVLALIYPVIASVGIVFLLAWILIVSGLVQGIGLIGARQVPHFWLQLISVVLSIVVGLLLLRQPDAGLLVFSALLDRLFHGRGHGQDKLRADHQAVPQLGLGAWRQVSSASCLRSISGPISPGYRNGCSASCSASSSSLKARHSPTWPGASARAERQA